MIKLIKNIEGEVLRNIVTNVPLLTSVTGEIQREDYINLNGLVAMIQTLSRTEFSKALDSPMEFGLKPSIDKKIITLEISY